MVIDERAIIVRGDVCLTYYVWAACEERVNLERFRNVLVHECYSLKALITSEQVNTTEWSEKKKNLN